MVGLCNKAQSATQQARAADRLDRGDFGIQMQQNSHTDLSLPYSQPAADAQGVGWPIKARNLADRILDMSLEVFV